MWDTQELEDLHCGIDLITQDGSTEVYNIEGGIYCGYYGATHHVRTKTSDAIFIGVTNVLEYQFTHVDADFRFEQGQYIALDVLTGNYGLIGEYVGDVAHLHTVIKAFSDTTSLNLCMDVGKGITYLHPFDPFNNIIFP